MVPDRRPISESEAEVIRTALTRAPVGPLGEAARDVISGLQVVARCECGCASVDFDAPVSDRRSTVIADGTGQTLSGGQVGVIVWGRCDAITGLEVYDLGAAEDDLGLPVTTSATPWQRGAPR